MPSMAQTFRISRAPMAALALVGVYWGGFAGLVPDIKANAGATDAQFGMAMLMSALGSMSAIFVAPWVYGRLGRLCLPVAGLALVFALNYLLLATDVFRLGVVLFFTGASVAMLDTSSNIRISRLESKHDASLMNVNHALFSFGFCASALVTAPLREAGWGPHAILPLLAVCSIALVALSFEGLGTWRTAAPGDEGRAAPRKGPFWSVVLLTAVVLFAGFVGENGTEAWSALHIERTLGAGVGHGSYGPAVLGGVMGVARLFGQVAVARFGERNMIAVSAVLGSMGALLIAAAWAPWVVLVGVAVVAVGMAVVVPSVNTVLGRRVPDHLRALALSRAWMFGMTGYFAGPAMMGLVSQAYGLRAAFVVVAVVVALIVPAILVLGRIQPVVRPVRTAQA